MAREVVWTVPAVEDLEAATVYIARDSEIYAVAFAKEVTEAAEALSEFAERGQVVPEFGDATIRELILRPYRLVYRVHGNSVVLLALVHGARRARRL